MRQHLTTTLPALPLSAGGAVHANTHSRRSVFIVGGGPSLRGFDFSTLARHRVIAVNDSCKSVPFADAVVSIDSTWMCSRVKDLDIFMGKAYLAMREGAEIPSEILMRLRWGTITMLRLCSEPRLSLRWGTVHGCTSGRAALNLAVLLGYTRIYLLGYDYCHPGQHHHAPYEWPSGAPVDVWEQWASEYGMCVPQLVELGVEVINVGSDSKIDAFPKLPLAEVNSILGDKR